MIPRAVVPSTFVTWPLPSKCTAAWWHGWQRTDYDESGLEVHDPKDAAAGATAVAVSMKRSLERMGPARTASTVRPTSSPNRGASSSDRISAAACVSAPPASSSRKRVTRNSV